MCSVLMGSQPELDTARLLLRPFKSSDSESVQSLAGDWRIADTTENIPHPYPEGLAESWISSHKQDWDSGIGVTYAIVLREGQFLIGAVGLVEIRENEAELGYWVAVPYWNQGYCTEAVNSLVEFSFSNLPIRRIFAKHLAKNPASGRVLLKAGLSHTGGSHEDNWKSEGRVEIELYERFRS